MKVEVDVLGSASPIVRTYQRHRRSIASDLRSCVKVEVDVLGSPSLKVLMVFEAVKQL